MAASGPISPAAEYTVSLGLGGSRNFSLHAFRSAETISRRSVKLLCLFEAVIKHHHSTDHGVR